MRKLLIVDDIDTNREILKKLLSDEYDIIEAENGKEALTAMHDGRKYLSAVILDLLMPVMDGFEVLRQRSGNIALAQIPVIAVTGSTDEESKVLALSLGANDYMTKPYNPEIIRHCLHNTISLRENASIINAMQRDKLTGILSREAFFDKASALLHTRPAGSYIMACLDIDNFKLINDQYSTAEGDRILQYIAGALQEVCNLVGGICCRISADNFAALYPNDEATVQRITKAHDAGFIPENCGINLTFSVGRYVANDLALPVSAMYDRAFIAKQSVKGLYGERTAYFDENMLDTLIREQQIISDMDEALSRGQFEVWYQPQFNHATGALVGAEALARWRHPKKGLLFPALFIPIFEQNGFIYELDKFVWEQACIFLRRQLDEGLVPLPVSVNVSRYDAYKEDLTDCITGLIEKYDISPELLHLEITESAFAQSPEKIIEIVKRLMDKGFTLEIDDFGSGYSSLNILKDVPADVLKLDMCFLEGRENSQRGGNILESIVRMAKWIGMSVLAEGVETIEQADFLKSIGCNFVQGYLYACPMPEIDYEKLVLSVKHDSKKWALKTVEHLDNDAFWDPHSMDTLIFNSFIGGACIYEYRGGSIEMLRANDKYAQVIGSAGMTVDDALKLNWAEYLDEENRRLFLEDLQKSIDTRDEVTGEFMFTGLPGCPRETYLRTTIRVIASSDDRYLVYCTNENITSQKQAELRERVTSERLTAIMDDVGSGITAAVFEDHHAKFLMANDKYYAMIGYTREQYESEVQNQLNLVCDEDRERVERESREAYLTERSTRAEYRVRRRSGEIIWVRALYSTTRFTGIGQAVQLSVFTDITAEKQAETELRETDEQIRFLNSMAHDLLAQADSEAGIVETLSKLLKYFGANRAYVFEFDRGRSAANNTYEVCAEGVTHEKDNLQNVSLELLDGWIHTFDRQNYINIPDVEALTGGSAEKEMLLAQGIRSLLAVPLRRDGELIGFIGLDDPRQQQMQIARLEAIGDYIAVMLTRRDLNAKIYSDSIRLHNLMNDMPGGFVRMQVLPGGGVAPVYFNEGFFHLVSMNYDELMALYGKDALAGVHPDDYPMVREAVNRLLEKGQVHSAPYRLKCGKGGYLWVMFFGRVTKGDNGETFINTFYTDASEQNKLEQERRELLDNLPCGAALYELENDAITAVHLNKRYRQLVNRELADLSGISVLSSVHPDEREDLMDELRLSIREHRDVERDIRLLYGHGGEYHAFHMIGRAVHKEDDKYSLYVTYHLIPDEKLSYQEMLPIALAAVMRSSQDLSFVKDRDHRFICCSRSFARLAGFANERELVGKTDLDLLEPERAMKYHLDEEKILATGREMLDVNEALETPDGVTKYSSTSKYPLMDAAGSVIGIYGITRDTTEYHTAFDRLKLLTNNIPGGIASLTVTGSGMHFTYFNEGMYAYSGYTLEEYTRLSGENPLFLVFEEDRESLTAAVMAVHGGREQVLQCCYRCCTKGGRYRWFSLKGMVSERHRETTVLNIVQFDITEQKETEEQLRISKERFRIAAALGDRTVARYDIVNDIFYHDTELLLGQGFGRTIEHALGTFINSGAVDPLSIPDFVLLCHGVQVGERTASATVHLRVAGGSFRWFRLEATTVYDAEGSPSEAILVFSDVSEQREKEAVYVKWQQSLRERDPETYTLFQCNLSKNASFDIKEGQLLKYEFSSVVTTFNGRTMEYASQNVCEEDRAKYSELLNSNALLAGYYRGVRNASLEYRELQPDGDTRWLRLSVELVEYPDCADVKAYLMYENIDDSKKKQLLTLKRAETDPLTGVLNRATFAERAEALIQAAASGKQHTLIMLDMDGFKMVNDAFGHAAGDQALIDITTTLATLLGPEDLLGRLGGDEFMLFLPNIANDAVAAKMAMRICELLHRSFSAEVQIGASVGIAACPRDGSDFNTLYQNADAALYYVKGSGKDHYAFYRTDMKDENLKPEPAAAQPQPLVKKELKRRMLIVDDGHIDAAMLEKLFGEEFILDLVASGRSALVRLRHYGSAVSVVLLNLAISGMNGLSILEAMQRESKLQSIPVIAISDGTDPETSLGAIRCGAADFVGTPIDPVLLRTRVLSAVSKAENELLRAQNSYLQIQHSEINRYRAVLEHAGICVIEYDWGNGTFAYDPSVSAHIAGIYDSRTLWRILLTDMVTDTATVRRIQTILHDVAEDRRCIEYTEMVQLKTPARIKHWFKMTVYKLADEFDLTDKLIITLVDRGNELTAGKATEDSPNTDSGREGNYWDGENQTD